MLRSCSCALSIWTPLHNGSQIAWFCHISFPIVNSEPHNATKLEVTIKQIYWTLGQYDQVCIFEAPDDETAASVLLAADMLGNIRTQTMRAFTASEMDKILAKVP